MPVAKRQNSFCKGLLLKIKRLIERRGQMPSSPEMTPINDRDKSIWESKTTNPTNLQLLAAALKLCALKLPKEIVQTLIHPHHQPLDLHCSWQTKT